VETAVAIETSVLIAGGSLNGLTTALLLADRGVRCLVVERHPSTTVQYKFRGISPRSMEIYRALGIEAEIRGQQVRTQSEALVRARNLNDPDAQWGAAAWPDMSDLTIAAHATCDQDRLEPILIKHARARGADIRFGTELIHFEQDESAVRGRIRELGSGEEHTVTADYMVAADGASGSTLEKLGISLRGPGELQHWMNIIFKTDLPRVIDGRRFTSAFVTEVNGTILPRDDDGHWLLSVQYSPERGEKAEDFTEARSIDLIRRAAGRSDFNVSIVDARSWEVAGYIAGRFQERRVFLVGDNAHRMPPTGGFGGNTGIHDAHNLAWKLGYVLNEAARPELLDSFDAERRPVAENTLSQALARLTAWFKDLGHRLPQAVAIVDDRNVIFGQAYTAGALLPEAEAVAEPFDDPRRPSGRPGTRAPHIVLTRKGEPLPIHDLFHRNLVLLAGGRGGAWRHAAAAIAASGNPLTAYQMDVDLEDAESRWSSLYGVGDEGAVLVRPDGIIAWRSGVAADDSVAALRQALDRIGFPVW
jgi:putative polyketide hydroxylase